MIPRMKVGKGVSGAVRYVLGEGRDPKTGELKPPPADGNTRVDWIGGTGFGFEVETEADAELARRVMEFDALNQSSRTKLCEKDCVHLTLAWARGETPSRKEIEDAAHEALQALGMGNAKALFVAHDDEDYAHVHIVASKINPDTGRAYDLAKSWRKLSTWAEAYEREHGGIQLKGREDANELRAAIAARDPAAVLEAMTRQRATFTGKELERALQKEIYCRRGASTDEKRSVELERAQFADKILDHANAVHLAEKFGGPTVRYTTRAVIEAELHVLRAAEGLASDKTHGLDERQRAQVLNTDRFDGITREQARAFRHATGEEGLAIIDGLAGAGKSRTTSAVREAYEQTGHRVIGLAWTHKVVQDMEASGFEHTDTVKRQLFMLANGREQWNSKTVVVVDEAAMLDTAHLAMITAYAQEAGAKLILVGDDRQLPSIERGGMFGVLKDRHGAATLTEIRRQYAGDDRRASEFFAEGKFHDALGIYQAKGAVHWTRTQGEARAELLDSYRRDVAASPGKSRFIFAYTNLDVAELNQGAREIHRQLGRLDQDHELECADGRRAFAAGDRIQFTKTDKKAGLYNGAAGTIKHIENGRVFAEMDDSGKVVAFDTAHYQSFRHGYAGTIYKGQGATVDQSYLYHSEHWRSAASYVGMTRHREKAELFAAKNTAADLDQLARQMARIDDGKRYAASYYHSRQHIGPVRPMTAAEIVASFGDKKFEREQQQEERPVRPRRPDMGYSHGDYASQSRAALREHNRRQHRHSHDESKPPKDQEQDDAQKRKSGGGIADNVIDLAAPRGEPQWRKIDGHWEMRVDGKLVAALSPTGDENYPWLSHIVTEDLPEHGWNYVDFLTPEDGKHALEQWFEHARNGEAYDPLTPAEREQRKKEWADKLAALQSDSPPPANQNSPDAPKIAAVDGAEPLTLDDIAQRVQRIIDDPTREADETDPRILQALQDRREAAQTAQPAAEEETRRLAEESSTSEEPQIESSGEKEAKEIESAASSEEMTDSKQVHYSRWTGQLIGAAGRETTQRRSGDGGGGRSRTR